ncbi:MAG TPA: [FeFe] hydrogenase H-cluster maturation GTPase HydF [Exilispira sp.]|mgnify:CR=1 FL=1|nr:[FeFe] hydrogenase H-cluster maturation GTPase HydF [Exilispira sp.]
MIKTPSSERLKIVIFGKRNAGKSSLINQIAQKQVAITSNVAGTTTDPVNYAMELADLGPATFIDTAGIDDEGELGNLRIGKTIEKLKIADLCVFVTPANEEITEKEIHFFNDAKSKKPIFVVFTFYENWIHPSKIFLTKEIWIGVDNIKGIGHVELRKKIIEMKNLINFEPKLLDGVVQQNDLVLLVTPIDMAAPKGRLILPQVETIRELLDNNCAALVVKETQLKYFYDSLSKKPDLVITDSQAFDKVSKDLPKQQKLTSFSILMARKKGDLLPFIRSIKRFSKLKPYSKVLILETCNHHKQPDDIGTVKIPKLVNNFIDPTITFSWQKELYDISQLNGFDAVIMCGGCMVSRNQYIDTMQMIESKDLPLINYGLFFAWVNGLLPRAIEIFPDLYEEYLNLY